MVPVVGLEPTRVISPTDFESVTSANSITPALRMLPFLATQTVAAYAMGRFKRFFIIKHNTHECKPFTRESFSNLQNWP